jgi:hypothetical protein
VSKYEERNFDDDNFDPTSVVQPPAIKVQRNSDIDRTRKRKSKGKHQNEQLKQKPMQYEGWKYLPRQLIICRNA